MRSVFCVVAGFAVMVILHTATFWVWNLVSPATVPGGKQAADTTSLVVLLALGVVYAVVGGYWTAWTAQKAEMAHALALAGTVLLLGISSFQLGGNRKPAWWHAANIGLGVAGILLGGLGRALQVCRSSVAGAAAGTPQDARAPDRPPSLIIRTEGHVSFRGYKVWYRIAGLDQPGKLPLLCLHGGPGASHDYLEPLEELARTGRRVIFYDQLGGGNSDQPHDPALWTVPLFLEELAVVRQALGLDRLHILGQSWGGMLAMEYALTQPAGLVSLVIANSPASVPQWLAEANRLRRELPADVQEVLQKHEQAGTTNSPEYQEATLVFYRRHLCRLDPWPECLQRSFAKLMKNPEVYQTMWGPSEFHATGLLKSWDISHRLGEIRLPTLVISGRFDEATPAIAEAVHKGIPGSRWLLLEHSSHSTHLEEPEKFRTAVSEFLEEVERSGLR